MLTALFIVWATGTVFSFAMMMLTLNKLMPRAWPWYTCAGCSIIWFPFWTYAIVKDRLDD